MHRWAVIAEAANARLTPGERGAVVRRSPPAPHAHPDGTTRRYSRGTIDRWLRAWRAGGVAALRPAPRVGHREGARPAGAVRRGRRAAAGAARPVGGADRLDLVSTGTGCGSPSGPSAGSCAGAGLHRDALAAEPKAYGRYEAERPNERWITDVLVGPWVPWPQRDGSVRARLFLIVDDHSRLLVDGRFFDRENARACQELLRRAITRRGLPDVLYADNGAPFANAWLARTCAVLGIRLVHQAVLTARAGETGKAEPLYPGGVPGRGDATRASSRSTQLNDRFAAWAEQVANRRVHAETGQAPIERFEAGGPHRQADPARLREAFRWSVTRRVTRTATVPLEGNTYAVDPALVGRRVELRYDPEDLPAIEVFLDGTPAGAAVRSCIGRHVHRAVAAGCAARRGADRDRLPRPGRRRPRRRKPAPARRSTSPSWPSSATRKTGNERPETP